VSDVIWNGPAVILTPEEFDRIWAVIAAARDYCDDSLSGSPEAIQARYRVMREAVLALDGAK
jgi:hypothetical protein